MSMDQSGMDPVEWDQSGMNPNWDQTPHKKGIGCGCKLLILFGVLSVLLAVACCGGVVWIGYYFSNAVSDDPAVVAEVTEKIARLDIPEGLEPTFSFDMSVPFSDKSVMVWVVYVDKDTESMLVLGSLGEMMAGQDPEDIWDEIENSLQEEGLDTEANVEEWERYEKEIEVRGQPVTFYFAKGQDVDSETQRIQATGSFEGDNGPVMFSFSADAEKFDEETIVKTIESIR